MNCVLFTSDEAIQGDFIIELVSLGCNVFCSNNYQSFNSIVSKKEMSCIILDIDERKVDWIDFIRRVRDEKINNIFFVVITADQNNSYLSNVLMEGINAVFFKGQNIRKFLNLLMGRLIHNQINEDKRRYIRFIPSEQDEVNINLKLDKKSNATLYNAKLLNISTVGVELLFEDPNIIHEIGKNDSYINNIQFQIGLNQFTCDGYLQKLNKNKGFVRYMKTSTKFKKGLSNYISDKMNY